MHSAESCSQFCCSPDPTCVTHMSESLCLWQVLHTPQLEPHRFKKKLQVFSSKLYCAMKLFYAGTQSLCKVQGACIWEQQHATNAKRCSNMRN